MTIINHLPHTTIVIRQTFLEAYQGVLLLLTDYVNSFESIVG